MFTQPFIQAQIKEKRQSSAPLAFLRGIHRWSVNSTNKWSVTRKMLLFDDVIMYLSFFFISDICRGLQNGENVKHVKMLTHGQNDGLSRQLYSPAMGTVNSSLHSLADSIRNVEQNCRLLIQVGNERFFFIQAWSRFYNMTVFLLGNG